MQEYIDELQRKVGLTAEQAKQAVEAIVGKVKSKIPESLHGAVDGIFSGKAQETFSTFQQKAEGYANQAGDKLKEFGDRAKTELNDLSEQAEDLAHGVQEKAQQAVKDLGDKLSGMFGKNNAPEA